MTGRARLAPEILSIVRVFASGVMSSAQVGTDSTVPLARLGAAESSLGEPRS